MNEISNGKYDLEERTLEYAKRIIRLCKKLPENRINNTLVPQAVSSSNSTGANYIEANEALSKRDFLHRMKIARKEAKESVFHLRLLLEANPSFETEIKSLIKEGIEIKKILSAIIEKSK